MAPSSHPVAAPAVGLDIASVDRVAALLERRPRLADRCFTAAERRDCAGHPERWASRWAVKEAVRKLAGSLGMRPLPAFRDVEVVRDGNSVPFVRVAALPGRVAVSISHDGGLAAAVAVLLAPQPSPLDRPPAIEPPLGMRLPDRPADGHKGTFGTVVVIAGAHSYSGAAYLSAMGAARGGAGRVHLCVPGALHPIVAVKCTEVMAEAFEDGGAGMLLPGAVAGLRSGRLAQADAAVIGPGIGRDHATGEALVALIAGLACPAVVDADGLTLAAQVGLDWRTAGAPIVVTPHPAEMGRLTGLATVEVQRDRVGVARRYATERGVVVVLKGAATVVAAPDGRVAVDAHSTVALATAGTGDVLAGLCGAFLAAGQDAFDAAVASVAVHGEAGCAVEAERGRAGALATDVLEALPAAQERIRRILERRSG